MIAHQYDPIGRALRSAPTNSQESNPKNRNHHYTQERKTKAVSTRRLLGLGSDELFVNLYDE